jgi:hypothetical protein
MLNGVKHLVWGADAGINRSDKQVAHYQILRLRPQDDLRRDASLLTADG